MKVGVFLRARFEHIRNERRSRAEIKALQLAKFRRLAAHAQAHSPYYRDLMSERSIDPETCVPSDFPPLTKSDMMDNFDRIVTDRRITLAGVTDFLARSKNPGDRFLNDYVVLHSSGSSGTIGYFTYSERDWARGTALRMRIWPFQLRPRRVAFFGLTRGHFSGISHISSSRKATLARLRFAMEACDINDPIEETAETLNRFQPDTLAGYPSSIMLLVEAQQAGLLRIAPNYVAVGGEPLSAEHRAVFREVFGAEGVNVYGTTEHLTMGVGRPEYDGIYLFEDEHLFEPQGEQTFITNLFNRTQPLIRYVVEDRLTPVDDPSPILPFMKVRDVNWRPSPDPVFINDHGMEDTISANNFIEFFAPFVRGVQLEVCSKKACILRVQLAGGISEMERARAVAGVSDWLDDIFAQRNMTTVARQIEIVDRFGSGKFSAIVNA